MRFGWMEVVVIGGLVLLIFGPKRFGLIGRSVKRGLKELKEEATDQSEDKKE